jgi:hypothetical protein
VPEAGLGQEPEPRLRPTSPANGGEAAGAAACQAVSSSETVLSPLPGPTAGIKLSKPSPGYRPRGPCDPRLCPRRLDSLPCQSRLKMGKRRASTAKQREHAAPCQQRVTYSDRPQGPRAHLHVAGSTLLYDGGDRFAPAVLRRAALCATLAADPVQQFYNCLPATSCLTPCPRASQAGRAPRALPVPCHTQ